MRQRPVHMGEHARKLRPDGGAELGETRTRLAAEQRRPELALEQPDCVGQRWLGDATAAGGAGEMKLLAQREKVDDLPDFHAPPWWPYRAPGQGGRRPPFHCTHSTACRRCVR